MKKILQTNTCILELLARRARHLTPALSHPRNSCTLMAKFPTVIDSPIDPSKIVARLNNDKKRGAVRVGGYYANQRRGFPDRSDSTQSRIERPLHNDCLLG